jgi:hypothetical protein
MIIKKMALIGSQMERTMAKIKVNQVRAPGSISKNLFFIVQIIFFTSFKLN